jgi:hypothetical protein
MGLPYCSLYRDTGLSAAIHVTGAVAVAVRVGRVRVSSFCLIVRCESRERL